MCVTNKKPFKILPTGLANPGNDVGGEEGKAYGFNIVPTGGGRYGPHMALSLISDLGKPTS